MEFLNSLDPVIFFTIIVLIFSIIIHEMAHGYAALFLGDNTAERAGRLTLNPVPHIDFFGSVLIPGILILSSSPFLFGYAKPVPYNPDNLKDKQWGDAKVAVAGPISNLVLAAIFMIIFGVLFATGNGSELTYKILQSAVLINIFLAVLNLLPIPPLDGSKVLLDALKNFAVSPYIKVRRFFAQNQFVLFIFLLIIIFNFNFLSHITFWVYELYQYLIFWV